MILFEAAKLSKLFQLLVVNVGLFMHIPFPQV